MSSIFKTIAIVLMIMIIPALFLTSCVKVPAGHVGVKVYLYGGDKGIDNEILGVGRYWLTINEEIYLFPTYTQNYVWTENEAENSGDDESIGFQDKNGVVIDADVGISYSIEPDKVSAIFQKYRRGVDEITDIYLRNMVRDSLVRHSGSMDASDIYGEGKSELIANVTADIRNQVGNIGINIENIYWIGAARLPNEVKEIINNKFNATQKAIARENEIKEQIASAQKKIEEARGEAESRKLEADAAEYYNQKVSNSLTSSLVFYLAIQKWNGEIPKILGEMPNAFMNIDKIVEE